MRYSLVPVLVLTLSFVGDAMAQSTVTTYTTDINGHRVPEITFTSSKKGQQTEIGESANGRVVPREQTETRVISESSSGRVTETIVRKYNPEGQLASTERTVSQEQKHSDGGSTINATIYRSDVNGQMQEDERRTVETRVQGSTTTSDVVIAKRQNNSFQTAEKRTVVTTASGDNTTQEEAIYRPNTNGQFAEQAREVSQTTKSGNTTTTTTASYDTDYAGRLRPWKQTASTSTQGANGEQTTSTNIYRLNSPGETRSEGGPSSIIEQQITVKTPQPDGSVNETLSVRRPTLADPNHLDPPTQLSKTVCRGNCKDF